MIYSSVCSGIEAASVAWHPLGWRAAFMSEIEPFPRAVLAHRWPDVPLRGDFTEIQDGDHEPIDLLVGGTPCQSFSVAGLRGGLADERGNLALEYLRLAQRIRPRWMVWENVPGVLSSNGGRDFGSILGGLAELGYGWSYRILDAQHFGVPQRRRRVFVVGHLGDWRPAAKVLFEPESLRGDSPPRRQPEQGIAGTFADGARRRGGFSLDNLPVAFGGNNTSGPIDVATALNACSSASGRMDFETETFVIGTLDAGYGDASGNSLRADMIMPFDCKASAGFIPSPGGRRDNGGGQIAVSSSTGVRRLTPTECERLQGFPDDYTAIPWRGKGPEHCPDGPRYKALGNSMAVPVMRWIGERIAAVDKHMTG